ncbi:MAG TPA: dephospho-CoA kinase [Armatimonadota bacterium]|jgi:dephospho-CoA kinase
MSKMTRQKGLVLGVTGAAGSGKSTVTQMLSSLGAQTIDADALVRWAYNDSAFRGRVVARFGDGILDCRGGVDRGKLADIVFQNPEALADLEGLVHPAVLDQMAESIEMYRAEPERAPVLAVEVPLLFEAGADTMVDRVLTVTVGPETRARRLAERGWDAERIAAVDRSQMPLSEKAARADYVVETDGTLEDTAARVEALWRRMVE